MQRDLQHRESTGHFQDGGSALSHRGFLVVVTHPFSFFHLFRCQADAAWLSHSRTLLREVGFLLGYHDWINLLKFIIGLRGFHNILLNVLTFIIGPLTFHSPISLVNHHYQHLDFSRFGKVLSILAIHFTECVSLCVT
jgi:hypothetical protein